MKINEFGNTPKKKKVKKPVQEGIGSTLFGQNPVAAVKGMFTGKGTHATLEQDIFIKDFIGDAIASLDNGVRSGIVNPSIASGATDAADADEPAAKERPNPRSVAGSRPASAPPGSPKALATGGPTVNTNPSAPSGTTPTVNAKPNASGYSFKTTQQGQAPQAPLKPTSTSVKFNTPAGTAAPAGQYGKVNPDEQSFITAREKEGASPEQIKQALANRRARQAPKTVKEGLDYNRLNRLFESIMEATSGQSIATYMTAWFNKYMGGVDWQTNKDQLMPLIQNVENTYGKDKGKAAIKRLAQAAYAVAKTSGLTPDGAKDAESEADKTASGTKAPTGSSTSPAGATPAGTAAPASSAPAALTMKDIRSALPNMRLRDLQALKQTIDAVIAAKAKQPAQTAASGQEEKPQTQYMGKAAPNAGPATKPANPLTAPTINPNKGTVTATGKAPKGDITKGGIGMTRESKRFKR